MNQKEIFTQKIKEIHENLNNSKKNIFEHIKIQKEKITRISNEISNEKKIFSTENQTILEKLFENEKNFFNYFYNTKINENEKIEIINFIINKIKKISGISISKSNKNLKIEFLNKFFIILQISKEKFNLIDFFPKNINFEPYLIELNLTKNLTNFLCKIINNEFINKNK
jgi:hypothetical protein